MRRRSRSPVSNGSEAPGGKIAKTTHSPGGSTERTIDSTVPVAPDSGLPSYSAVELTTTESRQRHPTVNKTPQPSVPRPKRQDWCRWPICKDFLKYGICPNETGPGKDGAKCQFAHIRADEAVSATSDGYVRVCFDSMGLLQSSCRRVRCSFYHPPNHIRDQIIAKRHAQYLQEKHVKGIYNQLAASIPLTPTVNHLTCFSDPLSNMAMTQPLMCNSLLGPTSLLPPSKPPVLGSDITPAKLPTMNIDTSGLIYQQVLQPPPMLPPINWADILAKTNSPYLPPRPDTLAIYNWLLLSQINPGILPGMVTPQTALGFPPFGTPNSMTLATDLVPPSNAVSYAAGPSM
ncbi:unnamed protein product [Mesocestoides corti]|uniref:C3H1-type domain-containing protein n=1 Tax=Mesocestoides corti TaxID=53468 RepID=A0A0R3U2C0_MESCO|nr:unnamed protein product [Mesocestoides corti]